MITLISFATKAFSKVDRNCIFLSDIAYEFDKVVEYKELSGNYLIENFDVRGTTRQRRLPEKFRDAYLTNTVGHPNASNFEKLIILIRQIVSEILAELDARFGADQSGIMRAAACCLPNSQNFLNKQELDTLSELYAISIKDCD